MPYYTDKETYVPTFAIGEVVTVNSHTDKFTAKITGRKVTRNKDRCDTFYTFDNGRNAWEWAIEHTTYPRTPGDWADNIVGWDRFTFYTLTVEAGQAKLWVLGTKGEATIHAPLTDDNKVEAIGRHSAVIRYSNGTEAGGDFDNLGECIVKVSNEIR